MQPVDPLDDLVLLEFVTRDGHLVRRLERLAVREEVDGHFGFGHGGEFFFDQTDSLRNRKDFLDEFLKITIFREFLYSIINSA